ncbi:MAG: sigma-70 family RNA polymerase sigma factor [Nitriliruptorales bacterium]
MRDVAAFTESPTGAGLLNDGSEGAELEAYRGELTGYCYRMLGSPFDAEDAVQETMVRAWRGADRFEGRSSLRTWLYQIATHVCIDALRSRQRRAHPMELGPASPASATLPAPLPETVWIEPIPDARVVPPVGDPGELVVQRDSVRLAFVAALQHLPARQRAVLILRDVLRWQAAEVAELLQSSVASVNSALQRARAALATLDVAETDTFQPLDEAQQDLLARYVDAFERYDLDALTALLHEDVVQSMPPYGLWLRGHDDVRDWYLGTGIGCRGSRLVATASNGSPAFGQYRPAATGGFEPWSLQVIEISADRIVGLNAFLATQRLFPLFGLPPRLDP